MKKILSIFLLFLCFTFIHSSEKLNEDKVKLENIEKGKKIIKEIKKELNESLEEKVFRESNSKYSKVLAADRAFEIGKERLFFIENEEKEILDISKFLNLEIDNKSFLSLQFNEVHNQFNIQKKQIEHLIEENEKLYKYLKQLEEMEKKL
ncbi:hypothetical protein FV113G1_P10700 (plasmid) [Fusobacterium varium]|nr:hypothetical protein FV113G1_P10700 [Fusobacterium varium]